MFWLLEEPLVTGARLDITKQVPNLFQRLCDSKTVKLGHIARFAGPELNGITAVASSLNLKSIRHTSTIVGLWLKRLSVDDMALLKRHKKANLLPNKKDPFPRSWITLDLKDMSLLLLDNLQDLVFKELNGKTI